MPSARSLADRLRSLAPEALAFGVIGAGNTLLYMAITWALLPIGAVKASIVATLVTTTLAYLANRYWTYRHHTRSALRREYTLFFGFNLIGMVIQSGAVAIGKYGFGLTEQHDELLFMGVTVLGIGVATIFRFWAYRTFVFLKPPVDGHEAVVAEMDVVAGLAELSAEADGSLDAELAKEIDAQRRAV
ncbi:GtrA family protein [Actinoplanes friuliensis]|jgi:putative flippase GtrA|uniref:Putative GtrA-like protein n=1 Tax=Actinoplanes friuliensis DSM 7358 TaxID=1246995 RepID=U5WDM9_9ACTN|nr:GtrA family protein [Actinoplanes friuliensis]AGZ46115.1 putative GtrA-like protein [Actinoplanes friuliensis DSM 7358]